MPKPRIEPMDAEERRRSAERIAAVFVVIMLLVGLAI